MPDLACRYCGTETNKKGEPCSGPSMLAQHEGCWCPANPNATMRPRKETTVVFVTELVPMELEALHNLHTPQVFIALDVDNPESDGDDVRLVGWFDRWQVRIGGPTLIMYDPDDDHEVSVLGYAITRAFYAPMGYRP